MPFAKGTAGNPNGRPKGSVNKDNPLKTLCKQHTPQALKGIVDLANNSEDDGIKFKARAWICEQAYGKAAQNVELSGKDGEQLTVGIIYNVK